MKGRELLTVLSLSSLAFVSGCGKDPTKLIQPDPPSPQTLNCIDNHNHLSGEGTVLYYVGPIDYGVFLEKGNDGLKLLGFGQTNFDIILDEASYPNEGGETILSGQMLSDPPLIVSVKNCGGDYYFKVINPQFSENKPQS